VRDFRKTPHLIPASRETDFTVVRRTRLLFSLSIRRAESVEGMFPMASSSLSPPPLSLILLRPLPCRPVLLSRQRKPFPTVRVEARPEQRLQRRPVTGRWRRGGGFACFSYNANNKTPPPSDKVLLKRSISLIFIAS
jgi:hypothetical protein